MQFLFIDRICQAYKYSTYKIVIYTGCCHLLLSIYWLLLLDFLLATATYNSLLPSPTICLLPPPLNFGNSLPITASVLL